MSYGGLIIQIRSVRTYVSIATKSKTEQNNYTLLHGIVLFSRLTGSSLRAAGQ